MCSCGRGCARPRFTLDLKDVVPAVEEVIGKIGPLTEPDSPGGYFALMDAESGRCLIEPTKIGEITNGKDDQYRKFCMEKAERLFKMRKEKGHLLSAQSRDEANEQYGGAVCDDKYIWSFSGLPEHGDETAMLLAPTRLGQMTTGDARELAFVSDNDVIRKEMFYSPFWQN